MLEVHIAKLNYIVIDLKPEQIVDKICGVKEAIFIGNSFYLCCILLVYHLFIIANNYEGNLLSEI